jgi:phage tail-like protein
MDANGQKFWMVRGAGWEASPAGSIEQAGDHFQIASETVNVDYHESTAAAESRLQLVPMARDSYGGRAFYDDTAQAVFGTSAFPGAAKITDLAAPATDLALGYDGWFYIATGGGVLVIDPRGRYPSATVTLTGFAAWRLAADPAGGAWVLDRAGKKLARLSGQLWPAPLALNVPPDAFRPLEENPNPLQLTLISDATFASDEDPVAIACTPAGRLSVLAWSTNPADPADIGARVRFVRMGTITPGPGVGLTNLKRPFSFAWISENEFAVLAADVREAVAYEFPAEEASDVEIKNVVPSGELFPLPEHDGGPFLHGVTLPVEYPAAPEPRPLVSVSLPSFLSQAVATLKAPLDCGVAGTVWHRFYVEAEIPPGTGFTLSAAAFDENQDGAAVIPETDWHPHHFGSLPATESQGDESTPFTRAPLAAWVPAPSEIPGFDGFLDEARVKNRVGLFTVLIQRAQRPVRTLRGRFLYLRVELRGDTRATPCIHAIRAYAPRFSYQDKYLPALYREQIFGTDADRISPGEPPTRADFLGRFLANFEGVLTPLEDKVAEAWLVTDPRTAPEGALGWLGEWIGAAFEPWYPSERRREYLRRAPELFRWRGTLAGLRLALDIATAGGVLGDLQGRRRIAVVEDYWMRRTLATVLGVNLDRQFDPLFGGPVYTGNSRVGRTLFLTEGVKREVLALFGADIPLNPEDQAAVDAFFASLANRATVIVHETVSPDEFQVIERVTALEAPADTAVAVRRASQDFMVGLAALLDVDTFLRPAQPLGPVAVGASSAGEAALLRPPSLDPRIEGISS